MERIITYKTQYSDEEMRDLIDWFNARIDRLPQRIRLDDSTVVEDVAYFTHSMLSRLQKVEQSNSMNGYHARLFLLRERLKEQGME